jgi:hypothetical protein
MQVNHPCCQTHLLELFFGRCFLQRQRSCGVPCKFCCARNSVAFLHTWMQPDVSSWRVVYVSLILPSPNLSTPMLCRRWCFILYIYVRRNQGIRTPRRGWPISGWKQSVKMKVSLQASDVCWKVLPGCDAKNSKILPGYDMAQIPFESWLLSFKIISFRKCNLLYNYI